MNSALTRFINVQAAPHLVTAAAQSENVGRIEWAAPYGL